GPLRCVVLAPFGGWKRRNMVFDGATGAKIAGFVAFDPSDMAGLTVAAGDVGGRGGILVGSGDRSLARTFTPAGELLREFAPFESGFKGGVHVALGRDGDRNATVIAGAGDGGAPRVRVFDARTGEPAADFFADDKGLRKGVLVAAGDADGDGASDLLAVPGRPSATRL